MAGVQVIRRRKSDPWGDTMGAIGQGLSGFAGGYMGRQQMDMAKENSSMMRQMMERAWGKNGEGISPNPTPPNSGPQMPGSENAMPSNLNLAGLSPEQLAQLQQLGYF